MKRYITHLMLLLGVTIWGVFSYAYLGVEDGSSGLSLLGYIAASFYLPGGFLISSVKGSISNAYLPVMAGIGWLTYALIALGIAQTIRVRRRRVCP